MGRQGCRRWKLNLGGSGDVWGKWGPARTQMPHPAALLPSPTHHHNQLLFMELAYSIIVYIERTINIRHEFAEGIPASSSNHQRQIFV